MKPSYLVLIAVCMLFTASAIEIGGKVAGQIEPQTRMAGFSVNAFGKPVAEMFSVPLQGERFKVTLPSSAPDKPSLVDIDKRLAWPGLIFKKASVPAQAAEMKVFTYVDVNKNQKHDENELLNEIRLKTGQAQLFIVWASAAVVVEGESGYQAKLNKGWNVLTIQVSDPIQIKALTDDPVMIKLGK